MSKRIEQIRNHKALTINGINYGRVIAIDLYDTSCKGYLKQLAKCFLFEYTVKFGGESDCVFMYSLSWVKRKDYDEIRDYFLKIFPNFSYLSVDKRKSIRRILAKLVFCLHYWLKFLFGGVKTPFLCAVLVTEYKPLERKMAEAVCFDKRKLAVSFCDARGEDNLFTQLANAGGMKTVTLQHGQYRVLDEKNEKADVEAYKNFISDYLLAWGEVTRREFVKAGICGERVLPVGALKPFSNVPLPPKHKFKGVFGVVLCGEIYMDTNIAMIKLANKLAKKYNLTYFLRMHPKNNGKKYLKYVDKEVLSEISFDVKNDEYVDKVDFSIIHMTGVFVELLGLNSVLFVYEDRYMENLFKIAPYTFSEEKKLSSLYEKLLEDRKKIEKEQYQHYIDFNAGGYIEKNYKNAILRIMQEDKKV